MLPFEPFCNFLYKDGNNQIRAPSFLKTFAVFMKPLLQSDRQYTGSDK